MKRLYRHLTTIALLASIPVGAAPRSKPAGGPIAEAMKTAIASGTKSFDHGIWNDLLAGGVDETGRVDYPYLQDRRDNLDRYLKALAAVDLSKLRAAELEAFLINAYNAITVASILDHPAVTTIREIGGVWDQTRHRVGRFDLTLDDIEHTLLRPYFRDPRIHFAVNCASASCAPLPRWAFRGEDLDRQLDQRARLFLSDARNVRIEGETVDAVALLRLVRRRLHDRGMEAARRHHSRVHRALRQPRGRERLRSGGELEVEFFEYDWSLNAAKRPRTGRR